MTTLQIVVLTVYFAILLVLSFYGSHRYAIVALYKKFAQGDDPQPKDRFAPEQLPVVTVQLPLYNERYVVERLIRAVCQLDYPKDRLEIQVLDDSTDDTTDKAAKLVDEMRERGFDISLHHRKDRTGYKAGALEAGMAKARGEFIAVFDADFVPQPSFLRDTIDHFTDEEIGMVQARWEHINREFSLLTRAQAILLDGHFVLEHTARNRAGRFFNFNGTAGIWRKETIIDAGGWEHDTLTEDLDLSYRAQLEGWQFVFLRDVTAPSEIPVEMNAFRSQQHRWAKGSIQTALKLLPRILKSNLPREIKYEAFHHLTSNFAYLLMVILAVLMPLATIIRIHQGWYEALFLDLPIFLGATFSVCYFYWVSQREIGRNAWEILRLIPAVLGLGIGVSVNNAKAVVEAMVGHQTPFVRTPKYAIQSVGESWSSKLYIRKSTILPLVEFALGAWFTYGIFFVVVSENHSFFSVPFLILFQFGFFYVATLSAFQGLRGAVRAR
ncbi:glycosyltransferase [Persicimonas caeni]|uniref:Glycosyltransferase n=1 Tax=Persicimonas caeni TaxID=2292766 RepID=A0A4Y6Q338_PERCE|nr:glycosyltransferase [Persicimonas caeni]QED36111.1 glycosyltransferase [Persicimonas caeni]